MRLAVDALQAAFLADLAAPPEWAIPSVAAASGGTILIAEEDEAQRAILTASLETAGYAVIGITSATFVLDTARREKPALILLDVGVSGVDGYSLCATLKDDPDLAGTPVVVMTTGAKVGDRLSGLMLRGKMRGVEEFVTKPLDMRELVLRIQLLLQRGPAG